MQAKTSINATLRSCPELVGFSMLLDMLMSICERHEASLPSVKAISQLLPGRSHDWACPCCSMPSVCAAPLSKTPLSTHFGKAHIWSYLSASWLPGPNFLSTPSGAVHSRGQWSSMQCLTDAGVLDCVLRLHVWPHGIEKEMKWLDEAATHIEGIIAQQAWDASGQSIPEDHTCSATAAPGRARCSV